MENPRAFWDERYTGDAYTYGKAPNHFFQTRLEQIEQPGRVLLPAEGEGRNAVFAAQQGWQVTAVDFSAQGREKALVLAADKGVSLNYQVGNLAQYDFGKQGPWDCIGLIYAHFPPDLRTAIHRKCARALRPGGRIILEAFNRRQINRLSGGPRDIDMLYSKIMLESDFESLEIIESGEYTIYLNEGEGHTGLAEVVRFVLEKP